MPPHTTLHYTMPPNTTNSKSTATTANSGTTQMNTNNKSSSTPSKTSTQQRRASSSSYVFAPSWLNLNNKSGPSTTVLNSAYVSTTEEKSVKEEVKGVGASKKEGLGGIRQVREGLVKDGSSSLNRSVNGVIPTRSRSRDFLGSRSGETESHESSIKVHGRSRSVSQVNQPISSSSSSFDRNFPTLAKKKQLNLSVDLPAKNAENIWANLEKSKLLSPTSTTPSTEEYVKFNIPNIDNEPELERRMSLVPKVESGKLDGKRSKSVKRKTSRSLSVDSVARGSNGSSVFGFGVGIGISNGRSLGQTQNARSYLRDNTSKPINAQPQRQRAASISASNGIKKASVTTSRMGIFGQSTITGRKSSIGNNSKYLWSNATMGKMGSFKIFPEEEEDDDELLNERKEDVNPMNDCDHIEEEEEEEEEYEMNNNKNEEVTIVKNNTNDKNESVINDQNIYTDSPPPDSPPPDSPPSSTPISSSLEREEKFLLQLGWQKDADSSEWAITEEEKRFFVNFVRALNGISVSEKNGTNISDELSCSEINLAKRKWAALVKNIKIVNGGDKILNGRYQSNGKRVTFNDENGRNNY